MHALAIVIPAYKPDFIRAALESISGQTDKRFRLYIGDDGGPTEVAEAVGSFGGLEVTYHRYAENLGRTSLASHWNRCVRLTDEPWVWLFADDDVMAPDCVASFYAELGGGDSPDLLRFNTEIIDADGDVVSQNARHPVAESGIDFVFARLSGERSSYAVEYIFRRDAFDRAGGFVDYPVAWCTDDASWFRFSGDSGIRTLPTGGVRWRASGLNITDANTGYQREKLAAVGEFLQLVRHEVVPVDETRSAEDWSRAAEAWFLGQIRYLMPLGPRLWSAVLRTSRGVWRRSTLAKICLMSLWNTRATVRTMVNRAREFFVGPPP